MAPRGKVTQLNHRFVADFETCDSSDIYKIDKNGKTIYNQRVWLAGLQNMETGEVQVFNNLTDFMKQIVSRGTNQNTEIGFHNLKFDGSYILPWLLHNDYEFVQHKPRGGQFSLLVDERNNWYTITIQVTQKRKVTIWDTVKLFPSPLEYLPNIYNTPTQKVHESQDFYSRVREEDHEPTEEELSYLYNDLQVLRETLIEHIELYGLYHKKTQASQAFYNFEQVFKAWKWRFPGLTEEIDELIRVAYWGGISYVAPHLQGKDVGRIGSYDINASYAHKAGDMKLPYGEAISEFGAGKHPDMSKFWIGEVLCRFTLKEYHLPCIPAKSMTEGRPLEVGKWVSDSNGIVKIVLSSIDYITALESYDLEIIEWKWSIHWKQRVHKEVKQFVYQNNDDKVKYREMGSNEMKLDNPDVAKSNRYFAIANRAKTNNNAFYGKFGEEIVKYSKLPELDDTDDVVWSVSQPDLQTTYKRKYLPVAIAIAAHGRRQLAQFANKLGEYFLYCDTDSVYFLEEGRHLVDEMIASGFIEIDDNRLGAWSPDGNYIAGRFLRSKCYLVRKEDGSLESTVAGLPSNPHTGQFSKVRDSITWENFQIGAVIAPEHSHKLMSIRTKTGTKLEPTGFTIQEKEFTFY